MRSIKRMQARKPNRWRKSVITCDLYDCFRSSSSVILRLNLRNLILLMLYWMNVISLREEIFIHKTIMEWSAYGLLNLCSLFRKRILNHSLLMRIRQICGIWTTRYFNFEKWTSEMSIHPDSLVEIEH